MNPLLVVEDDADVREMLAEILVDAGYDVVCAADGKEGLELLRAMPSPPCLILLDLTMPVMNGHTFRKAQLNDPRLAGIPVIVFSASRTDKLEGVSMIHKPLDLGELMSAIREVECEGRD